MRYFIEVAYIGTAYSGFQVQEGQRTIQSELLDAMQTLFRQEIDLTGSSRTDAGVHALQNYFHFDLERAITAKQVYNLNAILPADVVVRGIYQVEDTAHSRFDAHSREYKYLIYRHKDPFMVQRGWQFPYPLDHGQLKMMADILGEYADFTSFSKRNTQVRTFNCEIMESFWKEGPEGSLEYRIQANRFLRGMIRGVVGTMVRIARMGYSEGEARVRFREVIEGKDCSLADFTTPAHGLYLCAVNYPAEMKMEKVG